jgi:uncharacterized membrane-anchored protein YhcB (DUF1043 family)
MGGEISGWVAFGGAVAMFVVGLAAGAWLSQADRSARTRIAQLEDERAELQARVTAEREAVAKHFDQTGVLFRDLTRDYTALYAHLAEGARELCPDRTPELAEGLGTSPLALARGPGEDADAAGRGPEAVEQGPRVAGRMPEVGEASNPTEDPENPADAPAAQAGAA